MVLENTKHWHEMEKAHRKESTWKKTDVAQERGTWAAARSAYKLLTDAKSIKWDIPYGYRHVDTTCYLGFSALRAEILRHNTELFFCFPASRDRQRVLGLRWQRRGSGGRHGVGPALDPCAVRRQQRLVSFSKWRRRPGRRTATLLGLGISERACSWGCRAGCAARPGSRCRW